MVKSVVEFDLDRIEQAWQDASDADVIRALLSLNDYPPSVLTLIQDEARRRGIDTEHPVLPVSPPSPLARIGRSVWGWICRHHILSGVGLGLAVRLGMIPMGRITGVPVAVAYTCAILFWLTFLGLLGAICIPLRSYWTVLLTTLAAFVTLAVALLVEIVRFHMRNPTLPPLSALLPGALGWLVPFFGIPCVLLCAVVFVRRRYWPVHPPGYCKKCAYDLRYLPLPRCPECGTPFDPAAVPEPGDSEELRS